MKTRTEKNKKLREQIDKDIELLKAVDHPAHYNRNGAMECLDEMIMIWGKENVATWCEMTAYKYRYRAGAKGSAKEDMAKSDWYMNKARTLKEQWEL